MGKIVGTLQWSDVSEPVCEWCELMFGVQAIRVLGVLGALDPYRHKVHLGEVSLSRDSGAMSEAKPLQEASQQGIVLSIFSTGFVLYSNAPALKLVVCYFVYYCISLICLFLFTIYLSIYFFSLFL